MLLTLEEVCRPLAHSRMDICLDRVSGLISDACAGHHLRRFDMIVEVVPEGLDVRDVLVAALRCQVTGEENWALSAGMREVKCKPDGFTKCDIAYFPIACILEARNALQFKGRVAPEEHLRCILQSQDTSPSIDEFLHPMSNCCGDVSHRRKQTCRNTFPKIRSVSSRKMVLKITVTRS